MANIEKPQVKVSANVKARITKLSKKTSEELINIILSKDKAEATLKKRVDGLIKETETLNLRIRGILADYDGDMQSLKYDKEEAAKVIKEKQHLLDDTFKELSKYRRIVDNLSIDKQQLVDDRIKLREEVKKYKMLSLALASMAVVLMIILML